MHDMQQMPGSFSGLPPTAVAERWGSHVPALSLVSPYAAVPSSFGPYGHHYGPAPLSPTTAGFYPTALLRHPYFHPAMVPYLKSPASPEGHDMRKTSIEDLRHKAKRHSESISSPTSDDSTK